MTQADDDRPAKRPTHEIGMDLSLMSAAELESRIALLEGEIARLRAEIAAKHKSRSAAENLFKF